MTALHLRRRLALFRALVRNLESLPAMDRALNDTARRLANVEALAGSGRGAEVEDVHKVALDEATRQITERIERLESNLTSITGRELQLLRAIYDDIPGHRRRLWKLRSSPDYERPFVETNPLVSVCIPTYNNVKELAERSLPSVLAQSHTNLEILVVGDAAPPEIEEAVRSFEDPRIRFVNLTIRGPYPEDPFMRWLVAGAEPAREGFRLANGQWIAQHSDDDAFTEHHVEVLLHEAQRKRLEFVYGKLRQHEPGKPATVLGTFPPQLGQVGIQGSLVHGGFKLFPHEPLAITNIPGDWKWIDQMMKLGVRIGMVDEVVTDYYPSNSWGTASRPAGSLVAPADWPLNSKGVARAEDTAPPVASPPAESARTNPDGER